MSGYYRLFRGWLDHPVFAGEPYSRRDAWAWLIENAAWKPERVGVGTKIIPIERGQLCYSLRFMAKAWKWNESKVRRYFDRLVREKMIVCVGDAGQCVVTICKYNDYQADARDADAPPAAPMTQERRSGDANTKNSNKGNNNPLPAEEVAPAKRSLPRRFFKEDEPLDPEFFAMAFEMGIYDIDGEWIKFRDWHLVNCKSTGNAKASFRTWLKRVSIPPQYPRLVK